MAEEQLEAEDLLRILVRELNRYKVFGKDILNQLTSRQRRRVGIETGVIRDRWGPDRPSNEDVRDRTARLEREAARAEEQVRDLESENENLRDGVDRLQRDQDAERNDDRDHDGISDRDIREQSDLDNDKIPDSRERETEDDQQVDNDNAAEDAARQRDQERERADEERRRREEQESQKNRDDGIDPVTAGAAAGAVAGAAELADEQDEQNAEDRQEQQDLETDQESTADADSELDEPGVDADHVVDEPSAEADNVRQTEPAAEQEGVSPYVAEEGALDNDERFQQDNLEQDGVDQSADQSSPGATNERVVEWDTERDGSHIELNSDQEWDGTVYQTGENGPSLTVNGGEQGQEQSAPDVEGQEQAGPQSAEAVNLDRVEGQTFTVGQNGVQFADQNQASAGTEGPSTSQAQGTQWRPPERAAEDPAIAEARATQGNGQQRGPGKELPPDEKAQFDHTRADQEPLSKVKVDSAGVATNDRPGTPAAQRGQDRDRGGRGNDGRSGGEGRER